MMLDMDSGGPFYQPVCICGKHAICLGYVTYSRSKPVVYIDHDTVCQWQTYVLRTFFCREIQKMGVTYPYMIFSLTDETFSLLCDLKVPVGMREERVSFYISLLDHCYWLLGSCVGAVAGSVLPINTTGIDFSMTALFTVIVVNQWMDTKEHKPAIIGGAVGVLCLILLGADAFLLPALTITAIILLGVKKKCYIPSES